MKGSWLILKALTVFIVLAKSHSGEKEECPRGMFVLPVKPVNDSSKLSSKSRCVKFCPLGFYHGISFKNDPSFNDLNSGGPDKQATLECLRCSAHCTFCLGPEPSACFVCTPDWIKNHTTAKFLVSESVQDARNHSCDVWDQLKSLQKKPVTPGSPSISRLSLVVVAVAAFSASMVFSLYLLATGNGTVMALLSALRYRIGSAVRRNEYTSVSTRATSNSLIENEDEEETVQFRGLNAERSARANHRYGFERDSQEDSDF